MQITFREEWIDRRLAYDRFFDNESDYPKYLTVPHVKKNLWIPDSFFPVSYPSVFDWQLPYPFADRKVRASTHDRHREHVPAHLSGRAGGLL